MEVAEHRFLRHIPTRWLQLLPVIDRVLEQFLPLKAFFQEAAHRAQRDVTQNRAARIRDMLLNPVTKCDLLFVQSSIKGLVHFETLFQKVSTNHLEMSVKFKTFMNA